MRFVIVVLCCMCLCACVGRREVREDYRDALGKEAAPSKSSRTVIAFLVDGLSIELLQQELDSGRLPNLQRFFLSGQSPFYKARTVFPSLTYPAIASLLTESTVDQNGIYGNTIRVGKDVFDLSSFNEYAHLNQLISGHNVFQRLGAKGYRTVSLDYAFHAGATAHTELADIKAGLSIEGQDYAYVDDKTIDSLSILLKKTLPAYWPDFVFIHLVGVDFMSHDRGPDDKKVAAYLEHLDTRLGEIFQTVYKTESQRQVVSLLTADHGFDVPITTTADIVTPILKVDERIHTINEGRFVSLFFPSDWPQFKRLGLMSVLAQDPSVDVSALVEADGAMDLQSAHIAARVSTAPARVCASGWSLSVQTLGPTLATAPAWECDNTLSPATNSLFYPDFVGNMARYFRAAHHPDAIVISKPGVAYTKTYRGQHGGPTPREMYVPLLFHGAKLRESAGIPALSELLHFL